MNAYEMRLLKIEEEAITNGEWIGEEMDIHDRYRKEVLGEFKKYLKSPVMPEKEITTDIKNPENVPEFIIDLETEVYKEGCTKIITVIN